MASTHLQTLTKFVDIEALIKRHGIDLIVVGTHGKGFMQKLLIG